jgi:hypothetical protein
VEFSFELTGLGWAEATLSTGEQRVIIPASYLTDVLSELLSAVRTLLEGAPDARCCWDLEPGEYRWLFTRNNDQASLRVLSFPGTWQCPPDEDGAVVFGFRGPLIELASAFADGIEAALLEYGEDGYKVRWHMHPFPTESLSEVTALVSLKTGL